MKPLYLDLHLGLGDAIICNGLVRWLARENPGRHIVIPCYSHNTASVSQMFADLTCWREDIGPSVFVVPNTNTPPPGSETLSVGMNNPRWGSVEPFDRAFYEFAGVPFDAKWDLFHIPESGTEIQPDNILNPRIPLIHDDEKRGFKIVPERIELAGISVQMVYDKTPRITDWRYLIRDAREIHCIDSSFMHLCELLPTTGKLFYHKYARAEKERQHVDAVFHKPWTVLE